MKFYFLINLKFYKIPMDLQYTYIFYQKETKKYFNKSK